MFILYYHDFCQMFVFCFASLKFFLEMRVLNYASDSSNFAFPVFYSTSGSSTFKSKSTGKCQKKILHFPTVYVVDLIIVVLFIFALNFCSSLKCHSLSSFLSLCFFLFQNIHEILPFYLQWVPYIIQYPYDSWALLRVFVFCEFLNFLSIILAAVARIFFAVS